MDQEIQRFYASLEVGISPPQTHMCVLRIHSFFDKNINFHRDYLDTNWGMRIVAFSGVGIPLMADIPVYGMMESYSVLTPSVVMSLLIFWEYISIVE